MPGRILGLDGKAGSADWNVVIVEPIQLTLFPERDVMAREVIRDLAAKMVAKGDIQEAAQLTDLMDKIETNGEDNWKVMTRERHGGRCKGILVEKKKSVTIPGGKPMVRPVIQCAVCRARFVWMG